MWELARPNIFFLLRGERKDKRIRCYLARRIVVSVTDKDEGRNNSAEEQVARSSIVTFTYRIIQSGEIAVAVLEPIDELHRVVRWVAFSVRRHAEHRQTVRDVFQMHQLLLPSEKKNVCASLAEFVITCFPLLSCENFRNLKNT